MFGRARRRALARIKFFSRAAHFFLSNSQADGHNARVREIPGLLVMRALLFAFPVSDRGPLSAEGGGVVAGMGRRGADSQKCEEVSRSGAVFGVLRGFGAQNGRTDSICTTTTLICRRTDSICTTTSRICTTTDFICTTATPICTPTDGICTRTGSICTATTGICTTTDSICTTAGGICTTTDSTCTTTGPICTAANSIRTTPVTMRGGRGGRGRAGGMAGQLYFNRRAA